MSRLWAWTVGDDSGYCYEKNEEKRRFFKRGWTRRDTMFCSLTAPTGVRIPYGTPTQQNLMISGVYAVDKLKFYPLFTLRPWPGAAINDSRHMSHSAKSNISKNLSFGGGASSLHISTSIRTGSKR